MAEITINGMKLTLLEKLTATDIDKLQLHSTADGVRREAGDAPAYYVDAKTFGFPVYYIKDSNDPKVDDWAIHAVDIDVIKHLLKANTSADDTKDTTDEGK